MILNIISAVIFHPFVLQDYLLLGVIVVLLCCSAMVSASETAFFSLSPHQIELLHNHPSRSNQAALKLLDRSEYLLSTILVANNLVNICIVVLSNALIDSWIDFGGANGVEFLVKMVIVTFLLLLFGEIMPKIFANFNSMRVVGLMAVPLRFFYALFRPICRLLIRSGNLINRRMSQKQVNISMDELSNAIEMTSDQTVEEKKIVGTDLMVVQWRWPVGEPLVKNLGKSIYEVRSTLKNRIVRILFAQVFDKLVLLHAFIKKTQKTDDKDIKLAIKRLKEIENEK